jgi:hypothetical protein
MAKKLTTTAKELAFKAYCEAFRVCGVTPEETLTERFENWWSDNYGNRDTIQFNPKYNVYVEGRRYIQAD